jgi:hypothetical protein
VRLEVIESQVDNEKKWRFFAPSWVVRDTFEIRVNGKKTQQQLTDSFAEIAVPLSAGTVIEVAFEQDRGPRQALNPEPGQADSRFFDGPLLLGSATENAGESLTPILDLLAPTGPGGEPYVFFQKQRSQPLENAGVARKSLNLAGKAQVFRRDTPADAMLGEVDRLFGEFKHDRSLTICGFLWSSPQEVRQVILQWPESDAMPKPEEVEVRWSEAGEFHTVSQPGIIGNGRQWVYTLSKASQSAAVDNLVVAARSSDVTLVSLGIPDVEILSGQ